MFSAPFAGDAPVSDGAPIAEPTRTDEHKKKGDGD